MSSMNLITKHLGSRLIFSESGAVNEFLGFLLFLAFTLGLFIPAMLELILYNEQGKELDRLTKSAAEKACASMITKYDINPNNPNSVQTELGVGYKIADVEPVARAIFSEEAAHPETYPQSSIKLKLLDPNNNEISSSTATVNIPNPNGKGMVQVQIAGSNSATGLCPSGMSSVTNGDWKWCINSSDQQIRDMFARANTVEGIAINEDLVTRLQMMQPRCLSKDTNCDDILQTSYGQRIDRCVVCADKLRESIFDRTIFQGVLSCGGDIDKKNAFFPCKINTCSSARYLNFSGTRQYTSYQSDHLLGKNYIPAADDPSASDSKIVGAPVTPPPDLYKDLGGEFKPVPIR
ncbi:MAG: hypothetical protein SFT81_06340 [Candidatus Caenarcaniphilales bacterium]|nr:hypothetical protein [Candidatus Caenarcaniphilales bacterium]